MSCGREDGDSGKQLLLHLKIMHAYAIYLYSHSMGVIMGSIQDQKKKHSCAMSHSLHVSREEYMHSHLKERSGFL